MLRFFDLSLSTLGLLVGFPILVVIFLLGYLDTGSPLFVQTRVGKDKKSFELVKFRTMLKNTMPVASHLASATQITKLGRFLRRTKLDELPQLWNVLKGEMSLVGPRPSLYNQIELINAREALGVYEVRPGITGLAQINGVNMSTPELLAKTDREMIDSLSVFDYLKYICITILGRGRGDQVPHQ